MSGLPPNDHVFMNGPITLLGVWTDKVLFRGSVIILGKVPLGILIEPLIQNQCVNIVRSRTSEFNVSNALAKHYCVALIAPSLRDF